MVGLSFDWQLVLLPNGLRLITIARPGTPTVAVRAYVRAGSRYDAPPGGGGTQSNRSRPIHLTHLLV